jgi:DNA-binding XRE family transcriptional regulator
MVPSCKIPLRRTVAKRTAQAGKAVSGNDMKDYKIAKRQIEVSVGESVRIIRELQELSQNELARITGIPQSTISAIENDRINLGVERAKQLALALKCHPAILVFPGWDIHHAA